MTEPRIYLARPGALEKLEAKLANLQAEHAKMKAARREVSSLPLLNYYCIDPLAFPCPIGEEIWLYRILTMGKGQYQRLPSDMRRTRIPYRCEHRVRWVERWLGNHGLECSGPVFLSDGAAYKRPLPGDGSAIEGPEITAKQLSNSKKQIHSVRERIEIVKERRGE